MTSESGEGTVQVVILTPLLLTCVLLIVQFALVMHAGHIATAAAQEGARAARVELGSAAAGERKAREFLAELGARVLEHPEVVAARDAEGVRVEVTGYAPVLVPGFRLQVHGRGGGPVERFRSGTEE